jgi:N6-L-threonylcarbamoyladenine synthase
METSCDETSASVLDGNGAVLSNVVLSQDEIHAPYGGIVPELASRRHVASIGYVVGEALNRAGVRSENLSALAVTQGPGLIGSLLVGLSYAKALAYYYKKSLVPVDHLEAHIHSALIENHVIPFPAAALLVSGGHTSIFLMRDRLEYRLLARTRDDAAGEALDKIAKYLDLGYPGGPLIDKLARKGDPERFSFAIPRMRDRSHDYSFSGLKTAALRYIKSEGLSKEHVRFFDFLASFERAVIRTLVANIEPLLAAHNPRSLILCGGVARNSKLREAFVKFSKANGLPSFIPSPEYCTDNAAMVASLALDKLKKGDDFSSFLDMNAYPRRPG